uniref:hypothetical protein n=1 Tax=uncultured Nocardioides sp. TaxID=198441 RepID=UPI00262BFAB9
MKLLLAVLVAGLLGTSLSTPALAAAPSKPSTTTKAQHALLRAQAAFSADTPAGERPDATMALRKLWLLKDSLSGAERAAAERL